MAKVVGIHRFTLKPGVKGADFEHLMNTKVFSGLGMVIQLDKTITHDFTLAGWGSSEHTLLRSGGDDADGTYLWMIVAPIANDKVSTEEGRVAAGREAQAKAANFFEVGRDEPSIAAIKIAPFATRTSLTTFVEVGHHKF
jgi:hypothetical protein